MNSVFSFRILLLLLPLLLVAVDPAFAQVGGLEKVNTFTDNLIGFLRGVSISFVTIAFMVTGYKMVFQQARFVDCFPVIIGCLIVGGAAEIARFLME